MDKLIDWLFQQTPDGVTYLQVVVGGLLLCFALNILFSEVKSFLQEFGGDEK